MFTAVGHSPRAAGFNGSMMSRMLVFVVYCPSSVSLLQLLHHLWCWQFRELKQQEAAVLMVLMWLCASLVLLTSCLESDGCHARQGLGVWGGC